MEENYKDPKDLRDLSKERLDFEGNQHGLQFNEWRALFDIGMAVRKHGLSELYKWCVFSNRYLLMEREHLTDYKLFTKEEVLKMIKEAYNQGWQDGRYSQEDNTNQNGGEEKFMAKKQTI